MLTSVAMSSVIMALTFLCLHTEKSLSDFSMLGDERGYFGTSTVGLTFWHADNGLFSGCIGKTNFHCVDKCLSLCHKCCSPLIHYAKFYHLAWARTTNQI